ncbi:hypothetical protein LG36_0970 [Lactococcus lactis]|nr:hypothetical protein LG36_0970 [Lactococcus lactis]
MSLNKKVKRLFMAKVKELLVVCSKCGFDENFVGITNRDCKKDLNHSDWQQNPLMCPTCKKSGSRK